MVWAKKINSNKDSGESCRFTWVIGSWKIKVVNQKPLDNVLHSLQRVRNKEGDVLCPQTPELYPTKGFHIDSELDDYLSRNRPQESDVLQLNNS